MYVFYYSTMHQNKVVHIIQTTSYFSGISVAVVIVQLIQILFMGPSVFPSWQICSQRAMPPLVL